MWTGLFKSSIPRPLPGELKHLLEPHLFVVSMIRYLEGTLTYDELLFATLARQGSQLGLHVDDIWVDDLASLWGGRRIWGLPKNLAKFTWDGSTVQAVDALGSIATLSLDTRPAALPSIPLLTPGFGHLDGALLHYVGNMWARPGSAGMQIVEWPSRFPALQSNKPIFSVGFKPFVNMQVSLPKTLKTESTPVTQHDQ
jgi:hypothetical protein